MAGGRVDTMGDYLRKILKDLQEAKVVADSDLPFLLQVEQLIVGKLRSPIDNAQQQGQMPAAGAPDMQMPPQGMPPQGPPQGGGPGAIPIQAGGLQAGPPQPSADELRRLLTRQ